MPDEPQGVTLEELLALCRRIGALCHEAATMDPAAMRLSLLFFGDQLLEPATQIKKTKSDLTARSILGESSVKAGLRALKQTILIREEGDHARGGKDQFRIRLAEVEELTPPARAGPEETKEQPDPGDPAAGGRLEAVSTFPAEPTDETEANSPTNSNLYRL